MEEISTRYMVISTLNLFRLTPDFMTPIFSKSESCRIQSYIFPGLKIKVFFLLNQNKFLDADL